MNDKEKAALTRHEALHVMHQRIAKLKADFFYEFDVSAGDLRTNADDALALIVNNTEELYHLRSNPSVLLAALIEDYKFTWWQVSTLIDNLNLLEMENKA